LPFLPNITVNANAHATPLEVVLRAHHRGVAAGKGIRDGEITKRVTRFKTTMGSEPQFVSGV
jgi:hypothetical protein